MQVLQDELKKYRMQLFGIAILWMFLRHLWIIGNYEFGFFKYFLILGTCGVDIFLFLSGYGLYFSYKNNALVEFYKRRLKRVLPSTLLLLLLFSIVDSIASSNVSLLLQIVHPGYYLYSICTNFWFIFAILFFYIVFPFIIYVVDRWPWISFVCSYLLASLLIFIIQFFDIKIPLFANPILTVARIPVFTLGVICAANPIVLTKKNYAILIMVLLLPLVFLGIPEYIMFFLNSLMVIGIIHILLFFCSMTSSYLRKFFDVLGECSLEFYMIHIYIMWNLNLFRIDNYIHSHFLISILFFVISIAVSLLVHSILNLFFRR